MLGKYQKFKRSRNSEFKASEVGIELMSLKKLYLFCVLKTNYLVKNYGQICL